MYERCMIKMMAHEGETGIIDRKLAERFSQTLERDGFDDAMRVLDRTFNRSQKRPFVVTLGDNGTVEVDFLSPPLSHNTFRHLLGY